MPENGISVSLKEDPVIPGGSLEGWVVISLGAALWLPSVVVVVECETFIRRSSRLSFTDDVDIEHQGRHTTFQGQAQLVEDAPLQAAAGETRLAFSVPIPPAAQGSVHSAERGRKGKPKLKYQVAYFAKAELELEGGLRHLSDRVAFRVQEPSALSQFPAWFAYSYTKEAEELVTSGLLRRHTGCVKCTLDFAKHHFSPGEQIHVSVQVKNQSKTTFKGVEMVLMKYEEVIRRGESSRDELNWPSTAGTAALRTTLKAKLKPGSTTALSTSLQLPGDLAFTTAPAFPRLISTRYEFSLRLAGHKNFLHSTELLILPPPPPADAPPDPHSQAAS